MAKIAVELEQALARRTRNGAAAETMPRRLAAGDGYTVDDVVCTSGPQDRPFEEQHSQVSIAIVAAGSFQYRSAAGQAMLTPGSLMLGSAGQCYECGHEHGSGDRCVAFRYAPEYFERIAADAGARPAFGLPRLPPLRATAPLVARAVAGLAGSAIAWEELSLQLAAQTAQLAAGIPPASGQLPPGAVARVTRLVRAIERHPDAELTLSGLARKARLSPWHLLRSFQQVTGVTPHQYILRTRLREAALRLALEPAKVLAIALDCGFSDLSHFNHAFRAEFGLSPRVFRTTVA